MHIFKKSINSHPLFYLFILLIKNLFLDGKFILELARAREGEKAGWISVPRKTFWPPTVITNSSTTFSKHESSTSLSCKYIYILSTLSSSNLLKNLQSDK